MLEYVTDLFEAIGLGPVMAAPTAAAAVSALILLLLRAYLAFAVSTYVPGILRRLPEVMRSRLQTIINRARCVALAVDILACSVLFLPWAHPRETVSGLMGRWQVTGNGLQRAVGHVVGRALHVFDPGHCEETFDREERLRQLG